MPIKIFSVSVKNRTFCILTAMLMVSFLPTASKAQLSPRVGIKFPPGKDLGAPARTSGAGSRGPACGYQNFDTQAVTQSSNEAKTPLTALTPKNNVLTTNEAKTPLTALTPENNILTTVALDPKVYVYVPQAVDKKAEFRLIEKKSEEVVYQTKFPLVNTPGIVKIGIPYTVNIKAENTYQWQVLIICNPDDREADKVVEGWLKRTNLTPAQKARLEQVKKDSLEQASLYSEFGLWNEALMIIDKLRKNNSQAQAEWVELLTSVKLEDLAEIPDFDCCQVSSTSPKPQN